MFPVMQEERTPTSLEAIEEFESSRNLKLPKLYKEFLLATNGGHPKNSLYPIHGMPLNPYGGIQEFAGIGVSEPTSELSWGYDFYKNRIPHEILPIAGNGGGDWICLDLRNGRDRVVFWDSRHFWGTGEWRETDLYLIANSFEQFLESLRPDGEWTKFFVNPKTKLLERTLKLKQENTEIQIPIRVFLPKEEPDGSWLCRYEIGWPEGNRISQADGVDAIQAYLNALQLVGTDIYLSSHHKTGRLYSDKLGAGYGFPVPASLRDLLIGDDAKFF